MKRQLATASAALAIALTASVASPAELLWPKDSASELSVFLTVQRFRIYADYCSAKVPALQPKFESLVEDLNGRVHSIAKRLLVSGVFMGMKDKPVPAEILAALVDNVDDAKHNVERLDAASGCPKKLQDFGELNEESLKSALRDNLSSVQNMMQMLEKQRAR